MFRDGENLARKRDVQKLFTFNFVMLAMIIDVYFLTAAKKYSIDYVI